MDMGLDGARSVLVRGVGDSRAGPALCVGDEAELISWRGDSVWDEVGDLGGPPKADMKERTERCG